jgi:hypothetical protein
VCNSTNVYAGDSPQEKMEIFKREKVCTVSEGIQQIK